MTTIISFTPTQEDVFKAVRAFLLPYMLPTVVGKSTVAVPAPVIQGQVNRVSPPSEQDYIVMWPLFSKRLAYNLNSYVDSAFQGHITGTILTVDTFDPKFPGRPAPGYVLYGPSVTVNTRIVDVLVPNSQYLISISQTVTVPEVMAAGVQTIEQAREDTIQIDVHGPKAMDNVSLISTAFFDDIAWQSFRDSGVNMAPLFIEDPHQMPFTNDSQQYENRYVLTAHFQVNQQVVVGQQFADKLVVALVELDTLL